MCKLDRRLLALQQRVYGLRSARLAMGYNVSEMTEPTTDGFDARFAAGCPTVFRRPCARRE
jgi:hypothetical protein